MTPEARTDQVIVQDVGDEVVVYDERTSAAHHLNKTAALVWRLADGRRPVSEIAAALNRALDVPNDEDFVHLALAELDKAGLLARPLPTGELITRRQLFGVAAALLPLVASIVAPTPATAQTLPPPSPPKCDGVKRYYGTTATTAGTCPSGTKPASGSIGFACDGATNKFLAEVWDDTNGREKIMYDGTINPSTGAFSGTGTVTSSSLAGTVTATTISATERLGLCVFNWTGTLHAGAAR